MAQPREIRTAIRPSPDEQSVVASARATRHGLAVLIGAALLTLIVLGIVAIITAADGPGSAPVLSATTSATAPPT